MVSVKSYKSFFCCIDNFIFDLKEEINILILRSFFSIKIEKSKLYFINKIPNNSTNILALQIYIKLFEINYFLLEDKKTFNEKKIENKSFLKKKKVCVLQRETLDKLTCINIDIKKKEKFTNFLFYLYHSKTNNLSKISELKKYSFLSSLSCCENKKLKITYKNYFIFLNNLYIKKITFVKKKNDLTFLIILSLQILEIFYLEIGFTSSKDIYGMRKFLSGILKNIIFYNVNLFPILNNFPLIKTLIYEKLKNERYSKTFDIEKIIIKNNENIINISDLDNFFYYYNIFFNYKTTIKRIKNFCNKNFLSNENIIFNEDFYLKNKDFLFINTYINNFFFYNKKYSEEKFFSSINNIFDNDRIKNSYFEKEKIYIIYKLNFFLKKFLL